MVMSMKISCPIISCRYENDVGNDHCSSCGASLREYSTLTFFPSRLFNSGLEAAKKSQFRQARDYFSAFVLWCPYDREARNAYAMTCLAMDDYQMAEEQWNIILQQTPGDELAQRGLRYLREREANKSPAVQKNQKVTRKMKKKRKR